jgi:hypothetical protein
MPFYLLLDRWHPHTDSFTHPNGYRDLYADSYCDSNSDGYRHRCTYSDT